MRPCAGSRPGAPLLLALLVAASAPTAASLHLSEKEQSVPDTLKRVPESKAGALPCHVVYPVTLNIQHLETYDFAISFYSVIRHLSNTSSCEFHLLITHTSDDQQIRDGAVGALMGALYGEFFNRKMTIIEMPRIKTYNVNASESRVPKSRLHPDWDQSLPDKQLISTDFTAMFRAYEYLPEDIEAALLIEPTTIVVDDLMELFDNLVLSGRSPVAAKSKPHEKMAAMERQVFQPGSELATGVSDAPTYETGFMVLNLKFMRENQYARLMETKEALLVKDRVSNYDAPFMLNWMLRLMEDPYVDGLGPEWACDGLANEPAQCGEFHSTVAADGVSSVLCKVLIFNGGDFTPHAHARECPVYLRYMPPSYYQHMCDIKMGIGKWSCCSEAIEAQKDMYETDVTQSVQNFMAGMDCPENA